MYHRTLIIISLATICAACGDDGADESKDVVVTTDTNVATDTALVSDVVADTAQPDTTEVTPEDVAPDTEPEDVAPDTAPEDVAPDTAPEDVALDTTPEYGPQHLEVFFASTMSFNTGLVGSQFDGGLSTSIVGTGESGKLEVIFTGTTTGTYTCGPSITNVIWTPTTGDVRHTDAALGGSCTIVVTTYEAGVGGRVEGTFQGVTAALSPDIGVPFNEGSFSVEIP